MAKYTIETKRELIELVEIKKHSIGSAAKEIGISKKTAHRWMKMYEHHGYDGLLIKQGTYSGKFKVYAVEYMHNNNLSINEASAVLGIPSDSILLKWERIYYEEGVQGLYIERRGRPKTMKNKSKEISNEKLSKETEEDLIAEVQRLRAENAYLKKYNALVQEKKNLKTRKRQK